MRSFQVPKEHWGSRGVYKIQLDDEVYIGSTIVGFRDRFYQHRSEYNAQRKPSQMIRAGGQFTILHLMDRGSEKDIRAKEMESIQNYTVKEGVCLVNQRGRFKRTVSVQVDDADYEEFMEMVNGFFNQRGGSYENR